MVWSHRKPFWFLHYKAILKPKIKSIKHSIWLDQRIECSDDSIQRKKTRRKKKFKCQISGLIRIPLWFLSKPFQNSNEEPFICGSTIRGGCFFLFIFHSFHFIIFFSLKYTVSFNSWVYYSWIWGPGNLSASIYLSPLIFHITPLIVLIWEVWGNIWQ